MADKVYELLIVCNYFIDNFDLINNFDLIYNF